MDLTDSDRSSTDGLPGGLAGTLETGRILLPPPVVSVSPVFASVVSALGSDPDSTVFSFSEPAGSGTDIETVDLAAIRPSPGSESASQSESESASESASESDAAAEDGPDHTNEEDGDDSPVDHPGLDPRSAPIARSIVNRVVTTVQAHDIDVVVVQCGRGIESPRPLRRSLAERIADAVPCNAIVVNGNQTVEGIASILLPIAGGPHSGVATDVARLLSKHEDAWVDILTVDDGRIGPNSTASREVLAAAEARLADMESVDTWLLESDDVPATIIEQSQYYDLTVLGAPAKGRLKQFIFGSTTHEIRTGIDSAALMVHNYER